MDGRPTGRILGEVRDGIFVLFVAGRSLRLKFPNQARIVAEWWTQVKRQVSISYLPRSDNFGGAAIIVTEITRTADASCSVRRTLPERRLLFKAYIILKACHYQTLSPSPRFSQRSNSTNRYRRPLEDIKRESGVPDVAAAITAPAAASVMTAEERMEIIRDATKVSEILRSTLRRGAYFEGAAGVHDDKSVHRAAMRAAATLMRKVSYLEAFDGLLDGSAAGRVDDGGVDAVGSRSRYPHPFVRHRIEAQGSQSTSILPR